MSRIGRFFYRVRGMQRVIFLGILAYDVYLFNLMVNDGLGLLVAIVVTTGVLSGLLAAWILQNRPQRMEQAIALAGYSVMGVFLASQCFRLQFPPIVYLLAYAGLWFWFTTFFWHSSRPLAWYEDDDNLAADSEDPLSLPTREAAH